jgi:hypothetical protein
MSMQNASTRIFITLLILGLGLVVVYLPGFFGSPVAATTGEHTYVADVDYWQRTGQEGWVTARFPFDLEHDLSDIPLTLGSWQGEELPETNQEVFILLEPEQYVQRRYTNPDGQFVWLTLIGSRKLRSFHPPDLCYIADGWQTALNSRRITLADDSHLGGLWLKANKLAPQTADPAFDEEHWAFYFYIFPDQNRMPADGWVMFRITSPPYGTEEETLAVQSSFLRHFFNASQESETPAALCAAGLYDDAANDTTEPLPRTTQVIETILGKEGHHVVAQDIDALMALWGPEGQVVDANHTPNTEDDDQVWQGAEAIRTRYVHHVFPGAPASITPADLSISVVGNRAVVTSTTRIDGETAAAGDRWILEKVDSCWQLKELRFNLEPEQQ